MNEGVIDLMRALDFAARRHAAQRRKGAAAEPYINHLTEVARLVAEATDGDDWRLVVAALLHDTIEDTGATREELEQKFGTEVADLVAEVTDDKKLRKEIRKLIQAETAPHKSRRAQIIKIADKISNLRSITLSPPLDWGAKRKLEYFEWAKKVVDGCRGANERLEAQFTAAHDSGLRVIGAQEQVAESRS